MVTLCSQQYGKLKCESFSYFFWFDFRRCNRGANTNCSNGGQGSTCTASIMGGKLSTFNDYKFGALIIKQSSTVFSPDKSDYCVYKADGKKSCSINSPIGLDYPIDKVILKINDRVLTDNGGQLTICFDQTMDASKITDRNIAIKTTYLKRKFDKVEDQFLKHIYQIDNQIIKAIENYKPEIETQLIKILKNKL